MSEGTDDRRLSANQPPQDRCEPGWDSLDICSIVKMSSQDQLFAFTKDDTRYHLYRKDGMIRFRDDFRVDVDSSWAVNGGPSFWRFYSHMSTWGLQHQGDGWQDALRRYDRASDHNA